MAKSVLIVVTNCKDPAREADFNHWYTDIHLADMAKIPGFGAATRYELKGSLGADSSGQGKYLALYEIEGDPKEAVGALQKALPDLAAAGRMFDAIDVVYSGAYSPL